MSNLLSNYFSISSPHHTTVINWSLKCGYFELTRKKERRDDWIYIVDYSSSLGKKKCLLILGVTLSRLKKEGYILKHSSVDVLHLELTESCKSEVTYKALQLVSSKVGLPIQIVADHGGDLKKGIEDFISSNGNILYIHDIKHMLALKLKKYLLENDKWIEFSSRLTKCKQQTKQTELYFLSPTCLRTKSRYMNLGIIIKWLKNISSYKEKGYFNDIEIPKEFLQINSKELTEKLGPNLDENDVKKYRFDSKFSWLEEYEKEIELWIDYFDIIETFEKKLRLNGLSVNLTKKISTDLLQRKYSVNCEKLIKEIESTLIKNLSGSSDENFNYLGFSEIIESLFGKFKAYLNKSSPNEFGKSILMFPLFTIDIGPKNLKKILTNTKVEYLKKWSIENVGQTSLGLKRIAFA